MKSSVQRKLSTRLIRKGALIQETYTIFRDWDLDVSAEANLKRVKERNPIGAKSEGWLHEVVTTVSSRFSGTRYEPLVVMAQQHVPLDVWKPCLLLHIGQTDELYYQFATEWLFDEYREGAFRIRTKDVIPFVREITNGKVQGGSLSEYGAKRAARDLLRMAADFGLLKGSVNREFKTYHLPEDSLLYVIYALREEDSNPRRLIERPDWQLFLLAPDDVEREIMRAHQYRRLNYQVAGSLAQMNLPHSSLLDFVTEEMAA